MYQYALQVRPDEVFEAALVHDILKAKNRHLFKILGAYVPSGRLIFTLQPIGSDDVTIETTFKGKPCQIQIQKSSETQTVLDPEFLARRGNTVVAGIFNVIFKTAFR